MSEERWDLIDELIDELNNGVSGVTFDRDALETDRPDNWGAVELTGEDGSDWADGRPIEQALTADIWVCVSERSSRVKRQVQRVLYNFGQTHEIGWQLKSRNWLYDLDKALWRWIVTIWAPLDPEESEWDNGDWDWPEDPEDGADPENGTDPEDDGDDWPEDPGDGWPEADPEDDPEDDPDGNG